MTLNLCPFVSDKLINNNSSIEITSLEKVYLKKVANSFSVQVSANKFVVNPVKSLFSSFAQDSVEA